jgi:hypothetical protein
MEMRGSRSVVNTTLDRFQREERMMPQQYAFMYDVIELYQKHEVACT